jgi:molybdopterin converting factor small subunit
LPGLVNFLETLDEGYIQAFQTRKKVNVAVNQNHADWDQSINKEDEIAFFPPVTGG